MLDFSKIFKKQPSVDLTTGELKDPVDNQAEREYKKYIQDNELTSYFEKPSKAQFDQIQNMQESKQRIDPIVSLVKEGQLEQAYEAFEQLPFMDQAKIGITPGIGDALAAYEVPLFEKRAIQDLRTGNIPEAKLNHFLASLSAASLIPAADLVVTPLKAGILGVQKLGKNLKSKIPVGDEFRGGGPSGPERKRPLPAYTKDEYGFYSEAERVAGRLPRSGTARELVDALKRQSGSNKPIKESEIEFLNLEEFVNMYKDDQVVPRAELQSYVQMRKPKFKISVRKLKEESDEFLQREIKVDVINEGQTYDVETSVNFLDTLNNSDEYIKYNKTRQEIYEDPELSFEEKKELRKKAKLEFDNFLDDKLDDFTYRNLDSKVKTAIRSSILSRAYDFNSIKSAGTDTPLDYETLVSRLDFDITEPIKIHSQEAQVVKYDIDGNSELVTLDNAFIVQDGNYFLPVVEGRSFADGSFSMDEAMIQMRNALEEKYSGIYGMTPQEIMKLETKSARYGPDIYQGFTGPGAENYRESIIEIDNQGIKNDIDVQKFSKYHSSGKAHFPEPYQVVHKRTTDRVDVDGNLNNHLEEVQSDTTKAKRAYGAVKDKITIEDYLNLPLRNLERINLNQENIFEDFTDIMRDYGKESIKDFPRIYNEKVKDELGKKTAEAYDRINSKLTNKKSLLGLRSDINEAKTPSSSYTREGIPLNLFELEDFKNLNNPEDIKDLARINSQPILSSDFSELSYLYDKLIGPVISYKDKTITLEDLYTKVGMGDVAGTYGSGWTDYDNFYETFISQFEGVNNKILRAGPDLPFLDDAQWSRMALRQHILESIKEGHDGITIPSGYFQNIRNGNIPSVTITKDNVSNSYIAQVDPRFQEELDYYRDKSLNFNLRDNVKGLNRVISELSYVNTPDDIVRELKFVVPNNMKSKKKLEALQKRIVNNDYETNPNLIIPLNVFYSSVYDQLLTKEARRIADLTGAEIRTTEIYTDAEFPNAETLGRTLEDVETDKGVKSDRQRVTQLKFNDKLKDLIEEEGLPSYATGGLVTGPDVVPYTKENPAQRVNPFTGEPYMDPEVDMSFSELTEDRQTYALGSLVGKAIQGFKKTPTDKVIKDTIEDVPEAYTKLKLNDDAVQQWRDSKRIEVDLKEKETGLAQRVERNEDVVKAANDLKDGKINVEVYRSVVEQNMPVKSFVEVPKLSSNLDIVSALDKNKVKKGVVGLNKEIKQDDKVALRLDIPAYNEYDTWVVSIHDGTKTSGQAIGYGKTGWVKDVEFKSNPLASFNIATRTPKTTIARMFGSWKKHNPEEAYRLAQKYINDKEWTQVGFNPYRFSYFYDKKDMMPVVSAEEAIQIGPMVLAKNVVKAKPTDKQFEVFYKRENKRFNFMIGGEVNDFTEEEILYKFINEEDEQGTL